MLNSSPKCLYHSTLSVYMNVLVPPRLPTFGFVSLSYFSHFPVSEMAFHSDFVFLWWLEILSTFLYCHPCFFCEGSIQLSNQMICSLKFFFKFCSFVLVCSSFNYWCVDLIYFQYKFTVIYTVNIFFSFWGSFFFLFCHVSLSNHFLNGIFWWAEFWQSPIYQFLLWWSWICKLI